MSTRQQQREDTRAELVAAGLRMVAESGFTHTSTAAIAAATCKAHGTVFAHFATREALVMELVAAVGRTMSARLASHASHAATLGEVMEAHLKALAENEALYARVLCEASLLPLAARAQVFALQSGVAARLRAAYAMASPKTVASIDPVALANMWLSLTNHYLMNRDLFAPNGSVIAKHGAAIKAQMLALVMKPTANSASTRNRRNQE
jgi:AcrR family transcriptional regulator